MNDHKTISINELLGTANREIVRLEYKYSAKKKYENEFRKFSDYCDKNELDLYDYQTGPAYFENCYGLNIGDTSVKLNSNQRATRCALRVLDDIFQFGCAQRHSAHDYNVPLEYASTFENYFEQCEKKHTAKGTLRVKHTKVRQFLCFLNSRDIALSDLTAADISDFMITLCRNKRATICVYASILRDFLKYLCESEITKIDLSSFVPVPIVYAEESIPITWTPEEVKQLLAVIDRNNPIGKRDYAMLLLAILLGMRSGDILALKFANLDWNKKLIVYTQQKTKKISTLPLLPAIGDAIIDYLKNGRLESDSNNVFILHIHPYGEFQSSSSLSVILRRYMHDAGLTATKRKGAHSLRHTLASTLLCDGTPLMTIANVLGHTNPKTTVVYTKVDLPALSKCSLSYGE